MNIEQALKRNQVKLMQLANVTGVGIGEKNKKEILIVFVEKKVPESELKPKDIIPKVLDGYEIDVKVQIKVGK